MKTSEEQNLVRACNTSTYKMSYPLLSHLKGREGIVRILRAHIHNSRTAADVHSCYSNQDWLGTASESILLPQFIRYLHTEPRGHEE